MAKKQFFLIVDTETTVEDKVFDFGAVVCDRQGNIHAQCGVIVNEFRGQELFHDINDKGFWAKERLTARHNRYNEMVNTGSRMVASVNAINRWLEKVAAKYNPTLTAYNIAFDSGKCQNSGIDLNMFNSRFCLWHTACNVFAVSKKYRQFVLDNHYFGNRTKFGNMTIKTNAEIMAHFVTGEFSEEPHTALEDAIYYELPILKAILNKRDWKQKTAEPYNWKRFIVKDHFQAK